MILKPSSVLFLVGGKSVNNLTETTTGLFRESIHYEAYSLIYADLVEFFDENPSFKRISLEYGLKGLSWQEMSPLVLPKSRVRFLGEYFQGLQGRMDVETEHNFQLLYRAVITTKFDEFTYANVAYIYIESTTERGYSPIQNQSLSHLQSVSDPSHFIENK